MFSIVLVLLAYASEFYNIPFPEYIYSSLFSLHVYYGVFNPVIISKRLMYVNLEVSLNSFTHLSPSSNTRSTITGNVEREDRCWGQSDMGSQSQFFTFHLCDLRGWIHSQSLPPYL